MKNPLLVPNSFWCQPEWVAIHAVTVTAMFGVVAGVQFAPEFGKVMTMLAPESKICLDCVLNIKYVFKQF